MKNKEILFLPLQMQFFNDEAGTGEGETKEQQTEQLNTQETYTAEDVEKLISEKLSAAQQEWQQKIEAAKSEGEKLANLSKQEREEHEAQQRLKDLEEREAAVARRELEAETKKLLSEKQIPDSVFEIVIGKDADETKKNIDTFKTVFDDAVQKAVESRMAGRTPITGSGTSGTKTDDIRSQFKKALGGM